jgi:hypothetical protein
MAFLIYCLVICSFGEETGITATAATESQFTGEKPLISTSGGSAERERSLSTEDLISIKKMILPAKKDAYILGEPLRVLIEIKNINKNIINDRIVNIFIREVIDDDLGVSGNSGKWKIVDFNEISRMKSDLFRNNSININGESCESWPIEYELFNLDKIINNSKGNDERSKLKSILYNSFDVEWIKKDDVTFLPIKTKNLTGLNITTNSRGDWVELINDLNKSITLNISNNRKYVLKINEKKEGALVSRYINDTNYYLGIYRDNLSTRETLLFWYDIYPRKSGIFKTETLLRFYDSEHSKVHDLSYPIDIEVKQSTPKFEINPKPLKFQVYKWSRGSTNWLDIIYDITYMGGSTEPTCNQVTIELDKPLEGYFYYLNDKGKRDDYIAERSSFKDYSSFNKFETKQIKLRVAYPNTGNYYLPGIWINGEHYTFKEEQILVDDWLSRNLNILSIWIASISLIFTAILLFFSGYETIKAREDIKMLIEAIRSLRDK